MQQIADWLAKLGMSEYTQCFAENDIDLSVLPDLTDQDLEKLGVVLGDRRKMLRAIAAMAGVPAAVAPAAPVREINAVFGKTLRILGHAELFQPVGYLLHCGHPTDLTLSVLDQQN